MPMIFPLLALLAAAPLTVAAPARTDVALCNAAACTQAGDARVCKCLPSQPGLLPGITVDRGGEHLEWDAVAWQESVDDFVVQLVDLDTDGSPELVIANRAIESTGLGTRTWELTVVDGAHSSLLHAVTQDFGPDAVGTSTILITEWERQGPALVFAGREYAYTTGHLEPTRAPVLRRTLNPPFEQERDAARAASGDRLLAPRKFLSHASTSKGQDSPPKVLLEALVMGVSREDDVLGVHCEVNPGGLLTFSTAREADHPLRLGSLKEHRLYPPAYVPADAEAWLADRRVKLEFDHELPVGPLWLDAAKAGRK
jgi:hypothetical protein